MIVFSESSKCSVSTHPMNTRDKYKNGAKIFILIYVDISTDRFKSPSGLPNIRPRSHTFGIVFV